MPLASLKQFFQKFIPYHLRPFPSLVTAKEIGHAGERIAESFLKTKGYKILVRNYLADRGEIDLVCRQKDVLVFVEVKTRSFDTIDAPASFVDGRKQAHLISAGMQYLSELHSKEITTRFDIVEVRAQTGRVPECNVLTSAFGLPERRKFR